MQRINQGSLNTPQSQYLTSNDGLGVMDLPYTGPTNQPTSKMKSKKLIPPLQYIVYDNPQGSYDFLIKKGYSVDSKIPAVIAMANRFIQDRGQAGLLEFIKEAHPDRDLILQATGHNMDSNFCCGFDGKKEADAKTEPAKTEEKTTESQVAKVDTASKTFQIGAKTNIVALVIIVLFLLLFPRNKTA